MSVRDAFMFQHVQELTHYRLDQTPNVRDLVFTNNESMVTLLQHMSPIGKSSPGTQFQLCLLQSIEAYIQGREIQCYQRRLRQIGGTDERAQLGIDERHGCS